jgi:hypothetical protein
MNTFISIVIVFIAYFLIYLILRVKPEWFI